MRVGLSKRGKKLTGVSGKELSEILDKYTNKSGSNWDCIIPVSGGKDSTPGFKVQSLA